MFLALDLWDAFIVYWFGWSGIQLSCLPTKHVAHVSPSKCWCCNIRLAAWWLKVKGLACSTEGHGFSPWLGKNLHVVRIWHLTASFISIYARQVKFPTLRANMLPYLDCLSWWHQSTVVSSKNLAYRATLPISMYLFSRCSCPWS